MPVTTSKIEMTSTGRNTQCLGLTEKLERLISNTRKSTCSLWTRKNLPLYLPTKALLEYETIDSDQIDDVMAGKKVRAPKPSKSSNDKKMPPSGKAPTSSIKPQPATKSR